jgi:hypothetical protein
MNYNPSFDTPLSTTDEILYRIWKNRYAPRDPGADYDYRGAYAAGVTPSLPTGHWTDRFKKPNYPTFSVESQYAGAYPERAGRWVGDRYVPAGYQRGTDSVPAALTPREAVLNRNAAELAGRQRIAALNAMGNMLAQRGVDLPTQRFQEGTSDAYYRGTASVRIPTPHIAKFPVPRPAYTLPKPPPYSPPTFRFQYGASDVANPLADVRIGYLDELSDPRVAAQLYSLTHQEVGRQGSAAQQAFMETVFNRAAARGKTLAETINDPHYYPAASLRAATLKPEDLAGYRAIAMNVAQGSNVSNYATGNASGSVGFAGGPETFRAGGERFGIEGKDRGWAPTSAAAATLPASPAPVSPVAAAAGSLPGGQPYVPGGATQVPTQWANYPGVGYVPKAIPVASSSVSPQLASGVGSALGSLGQGIAQMGQAQAQAAAQRMAQARANVPLSNPLLEQYAADPLAPLRAAGLI